MQTLILAAFAAAAVVQADAASEPRIVGLDDPVVEGERVSWAITGLAPGQEVTVIAERANLYRQNWLQRSRAVFAATEYGVVDPTRHAPLEGWDEPDPFAFLWTMRRVRDETPPEGVTRDRVRITADLDGDGEAELEDALVFTAGAVREVDASALGTGAFLLLPEGEGPFPAVIALGGSEGGDYSARRFAARFAPRGYAVLGLPYYSPAWYGRDPQFPDLPQAFVDIPVERLEDARAWLAARDDVRAEDIGVYGISKGAEFALSGAARIDGLAAVAAIVPTDVVWEGWGEGAEGERSSFAFEGAPLPFVPYEGMRETLSRQAAGERVSIRKPHDAGRAANPEAAEAARIPVEAIDAPVYLLGGMEDGVWASGEMALNIAETRNAHGLDTEVYVFDAGHGLSGPPTEPSGRAEAEAKAEAFPALIAFFARTLKD